MEELKQQIEKLRKAIEEFEAIDLPTDHLYDQLHKLEEQVIDDEVKEEQEDDAPFRRVFLLVEVNKDDIEDALDRIRGIGYPCINLCNIETL